MKTVLTLKYRIFNIELKYLYESELAEFELFE